MGRCIFTRYHNATIMFLIYGRRKLRVKKYIDNSQACTSCKAFDLNVKVYREYFHVFFIPFFPTGIKASSIQCNNCGNTIRIDSLQKRYEDSSKKPVYLYSGLILIAAAIFLLINANLNTQKEKRKFITNPKAGDVYRIRDKKDKSAEYYFLRVSKISGDSIFTYHSNLVYSGFVHKLSDDDFFVKDEELVFTKPELKKMLDSDEIQSVERGYDDAEGFNRIK